MKQLLRVGLILLVLLLLLQPISFPITKATTSFVRTEANATDSPVIGQRIIPWRFAVYDEPNLRTPVRGTFAPQTVDIVQQQDDGWALIRTWRGNFWVYVRDNLRFLNQSVTLFEQIGGRPIGTMQSQLVRILNQDGNWAQISTWLGPRWINLQGTSVPDSQTPQQPPVIPPTTGQTGTHFMAWRFITYLEPDFRAMKQDFYDPQMVDILQQREDGWAEITTWRGNRWIYTNANRRFIEREVALHETARGSAVATLSPQVVRVLDQDGDWFLVSTWLGSRWVFLGQGVAPGTRQIAITFDDGPHPIHTARLLDALAARDVPATFYVLGSQVNAHPELAVRIVREGHEIANHSFSHPLLTRLSAAGIRTELARTRDAIFQATGVTSTTFRPPYGAQNATVRNVAAEFGYPIVLWSVDTRDWESRNVNAILSHFVDRNGNIRIRDRDIILMHDIHPATIDAAIRAVDLLLAAGFTFVTVQDLLGPQFGGTVHNRG